MTIHRDHPFLPPESDRDPLRRFRARMPAPVTVWTAGNGEARAGLTVSSMLVAGGDPGHVLGLVDPDSDLWASAEDTGSFVVSLLGWSQRTLADPFAGVAPAPGGPFRLAEWTDTAWGPALVGAPAWLGATVADATEAGWSMLVDGRVEHVELGPEEPPVTHRRGHYHTF